MSYPVSPKKDHSQNSESHIPVFLNEMIQVLNPKAGETYIDGTFGIGGYSRKILEAAPCNVIGIDQDPAAVVLGNQLHQLHKNFHILEGNFAQMHQLVGENFKNKVDGIVLDLGVSSPQLDQGERGFSFQKDGPLDMRMSQKGQSAADIVNHFSEKNLAHIIWSLGDEPKSRQIAKAICRERIKIPFETTTQLANSIRQTLGFKKEGNGRQKIDPCTKTFQALRIYVNKELESLDQGLIEAERLLKEGGRLIIISFHSLEDERIKKFLQERSGKVIGTSRHIPVNIPKIKKLPTFTLSRPYLLKPSADEVKSNPRSRSAHLRWATRTNASSWGNTTQFLTMEEDQ